MGWIFQGNPQKFDIDDYLSRYPEFVYWRTPRYAREIALGDRAFIWRAGRNSGAVAIGTIAEMPVRADRAQHQEALGKELWKTLTPNFEELESGIQLQDVRLTMAEGMITRAAVKADSTLSLMTLIQVRVGTVFRLSKTETNALERLWGVGRLSIVPDKNLTAEAEEGARLLHAHYRRERSRRLREEKLEHFKFLHGRLFCELCGEVGSVQYPHDKSERIFEVHHRKPLAAAATPIRTTLADLVVLCANCHRAVHCTADVEANFASIKEHFVQQKKRPA